MKKITYSSHYITNKDLISVNRQLQSEFITRGPATDKFEREINKVTNSKFCAVTNSATASLIISCKALDLKKNDLVWTTPNSFASTANCALICGAKVDFVDIELDTYNICLNSLEKKLKHSKKLPKIIIPVHFAGYPLDMKKLYNLKKKYKFKIIEDASHAIGAKRPDHTVGDCKYSELTVFSFQAVKVITTGEGGCITTNNKGLYEKCKLLRSHGITKNNKFFINKKNKHFPWYYEQIDLSQNYYLPDINCALGISQIKNLKKKLKRRNKIYLYYKKKLENTNIKLNNIKTNIVSSNHLLPANYSFKNLKDKAIFFKSMAKNKIYLQVHYIPIYRHPFFKRFNFKISNFTNCEKFYKNIFSLPMHLNLTFKDIDFICKKLSTFLK